MLASTGLTPERLDHGGSQVPLKLGFKAFDAAGRWADDPARSIHYAATVEVGDTGPISCAIVSSRTIRHALETVARFLPLVEGHQTVRYEEDASLASVIWRYPGTPAPNRLHFVLWGIALVINWLKAALPAGLKPDVLDLDVPQPGNAAMLSKHLGPSLRFGCPINRFDIAAQHLGRAMPSVNPRIFELMTRLAELEQKRLRVHSSSFENELRKAITSSLSEGRATLAGIPQHMRIPLARLRRELKEHDLDFRSLLDDVRKQKARVYLLSSELSIVEIAFALGYSDNSVFTRACHDWFGKTPRDLSARKSPDERKPAKA